MANAVILNSMIHGYRRSLRHLLSWQNDWLVFFSFLVTFRMAMRNLRENFFWFWCRDPLGWDVYSVEAKRERWVNGWWEESTGKELDVADRDEIWIAGFALDEERRFAQWAAQDDPLTRPVRCGENYLRPGWFSFDLPFEFFGQISSSPSTVARDDCRSTVSDSIGSDDREILRVSLELWSKSDREREKAMSVMKEWRKLTSFSCSSIDTLDGRR